MQKLLVLGFAITSFAVAGCVTCDRDEDCWDGNDVCRSGACVSRLEVQENETPAAVASPNVTNSAQPTQAAAVNVTERAAVAKTPQMIAAESAYKATLVTPAMK